jgi:Putative adhesin
MMARPPGRTIQSVNWASWRGALVVLLASFFFLGFAGAARAGDQIAVGPAPVLNVHLGSGQLTILTWDRNEVDISSQGSVDVKHLSANEVDARMPKQIAIASESANTVHGDVTLPSETFVFPQLAGNNHDAVVARGDGNTTITIPRGTALVIAHVDVGRVTIRNYDGVFVADVHSGGVFLRHVSGTGFAGTLRGPVVASNSTFSRIRARSAVGNILMRGCSAHQIDVSSVWGSIVYDNGQFEQGLARFESQHGSVALGVDGPAQIGAHTASGHIESNFADGTMMTGNANDAQARVNGGGPVVTATTQDGSVYLFNGSLGANPHVQSALGPGFAPPAAAMRGGQPAQAQAQSQSFGGPSREASSAAARQSFGGPPRQTFSAPARQSFGAPGRPAFGAPGHQTFTAPVHQKASQPSPAAPHHPH